jgi:hypothetical protein
VNVKTGYHGGSDCDLDSYCAKAENLQFTKQSCAPPPLTDAPADAGLQSADCPGTVACS